MDTRSFLLIVNFCIAGIVHHSACAQRIFDLGPKAGISSNDLSLDPGHTAVMGWQGGVFARIKPPLLPGVQAELLLSSMGSDAHFGDATDVHVRSLALQVPIFVVIAFGPVELHAGGYLDRLLATSAEGAMNIEGGANNSGEFTDGDYGLLVGAGLHLSQFYTGVRYNFGLTAIGSGDGFLGDAKNRQAQAYIAFGLLK